MLQLLFSLVLVFLLQSCHAVDSPKELQQPRRENLPRTDTQPKTPPTEIVERSSTVIGYPGTTAQKEVITFASGLKYLEIIAGLGPRLKRGDTVLILYAGYFLSGKIFARHLDRETPFVYVVGSGLMGSGWDDGILTMRVGGKRKLIVPPDIHSNVPVSAHRAYDQPTHVYDVELLAVRSQ